MDCVISVALMCLSVLPHAIGSENSCQNFRMNSQHLDQYLIGHELGVTVGLHHHACVRECMTYKACKSTDYIKSNATCKLNDVESSSVSMSEFLYLPGAIYSDIEIWPSTMVGTCGSRPCEHNQKCYPANDIYGCEDLDCYWPVIKHGKMKLSDPGNTTFRATATVQCNTGYVSSQPSVKCLLNSTWEKASCIAKDCGNPPVIPNGTITLSAPDKTKFGDSASVECFVGYIPSQSTVTCLSTLQWEVVNCTIIDCGNPPVIQNGTINLSSTEKTKYGNKAIVTCDAGYISRKSNVTCLSNSTWENVFCMVPTDCKDVKDLDHALPSGVYNITLWQSRKVIQVYCDMDTDGGGWTVFQRRINNVTDFYRGIKDYRDGFGSIEGGFWLGLTNIKEIADQYATYLRVNLTRANGTTGFELISNFRLEGDNFTFNSTSSVTKGFVVSTVTMVKDTQYGFSTYDHDVDIYPDVNCADMRVSAWWYRKCSFVDLNRKYNKGFYHYGFDYYSGLKNSAMMIKRMV